jgi:hypothetical protein
MKTLLLPWQVWRRCIWKQILLIDYLDLSAGKFMVGLSPHF